MRRNAWGVAYLCMALGVSLWLGSCGGASGPTQPPLTTIPATTIPSTSPPTTTLPAGATCSLGKGDVDSHCSKQTPAFLSDIEAAQDKLIRERPDIFNANDVNAGGGIKVVKVDDYLNGVASNLQAPGFCAVRSVSDTIQIKNSNDFSEEYDILLSSGHIYRGSGMYQRTCRPAAFPLDALDVIVRVPIFLFGYQCPPGKSGPEEFSERKIPVDCTGLVTATPKDKNNRDVPELIHGSEIAWSLHFGEEFVRIEDFPGVAFNKKIVALRTGEFSLCAVVQGIEGCFTGTVIP